MKTSTILYAVGAFAAAAGLVMLARRASAGTLTGDAERLAGVDAIYAASSSQQAVTQQAIAQNWRDLAAATNSQPDWWI